MPHFTTDGYISACDLVTFGDNAGHMDCFVYGKWDDNEQRFVIDNKKVKCLQERTTENIEHCRNCKVREHCGGYCLGEVQNETGSLTGQKPKACRAIKRLAESIGFTDSPYPYMHP
jgi:radical SAM protein with 4Fe4S-binding SPASM domain